MSALRYTSGEEDSARWARLELRSDDIVVCSRSKHGTTWVQAILLMLIHGPELPAPLPVLSPWLDHLVEPIDAVVARLDGQPHRRVIKTHTPLDGLPRREGVTYVIPARDPLDAAMSLYHQGDNLDRGQIARRTTAPDVGVATITDRAGPHPPASRPTAGRTLPAAERTGPSRPDLRTWLSTWTEADGDPMTALDSLPGVLRHLDQAWQRRAGGDVLLVHYADLLADREHEVRRIARALGIPPPAAWDRVVDAAGFEAMRTRAVDLAPDAGGILKDRRAFFREGRSGAGAAALTPEQLRDHRLRTARALPPDLDHWLHR